MRRARLRTRALAAALLLAMLPAAGRSASMAVTPVLLDFAPNQRALTTTVSNAGSTPMQVQVRLFRWTNGADGETYSETRDIGFSPPMFTLAPGELDAFIGHQFNDFLSVSLCTTPAKVIGAAHARLNGGVARNPAVELLRCDEDVIHRLARRLNLKRLVHIPQH